MAQKSTAPHWASSSDEIAAYNLAVAHQAVKWIADELHTRHRAMILRGMKIGEAALSNNVSRLPPGVTRKQVEAAAAFLKLNDKPLNEKEEMLQLLRNGLSIFKKFKDDAPKSIDRPMTPPIAHENELSEILAALPNLESPMKADYLQFLHKTVMMGILPINKCGKFRTKSVHVGNHDLLFPVMPARVNGAHLSAGITT